MLSVILKQILLVIKSDTVVHSLLCLAFTQMRPAPFTPEEDNMILEMKRAKKTYEEIAREVNIKIHKIPDGKPNKNKHKGRSPNGIRQRYDRFISTKMQRPFTSEDISKILWYRNACGNDWEKISILMGDRTPRELENYWKNYSRILPTVQDPTGQCILPAPQLDMIRMPRLTFWRSDPIDITSEIRTQSSQSSYGYTSRSRPEPNIFDYTLSDSEY